jgi:hypothetical protein
MTTLSVLSPRGLEQLRRDHERLRLEVRELRAAVRALGHVTRGSVLELAKTDGTGISAMTGDTPGSGTITPYRIRGDGTITALSHTETCYNLAGAVAATTYIGILRDAWGRPWAIVEDCT